MAKMGPVHSEMGLLVSKRTVKKKIKESNIIIIIITKYRTQHRPLGVSDTAGRAKLVSSVSQFDVYVI